MSEVDKLITIENVCRFCRDEVNPNEPNIVIPCKCKNYLHQKCYNGWNNTKTSNACEVCNYEYEYEYENVKCSKTKVFGFTQKLCLLFLVIVCYTVPHCIYYRYDVLYPEGISVSTCHERCQEYEYIPLGKCNCATKTSTNQNTLCFLYVNGSISHHQCVNPTDYTILYHEINWTLIWATDSAVDIFNYVIFFLMLYSISIIYLLNKKQNPDVPTKENVSTQLNKSTSRMIMVAFLLYIGTFILKGVGMYNLTTTIDDYYVVLLIVRCSTCLVSILFFMAIFTELEEENEKCIYAMCFTIMSQLFMHAIGIWTLILVFPNVEKFHTPEWRTPNFYTYCVGLLTSIIISVAIILLYVIKAIIVALDLPSNAKRYAKSIKRFFVNMFCEGDIILANYSGSN
jgi:hypothetical protein